jgi:putative glycosyltransferase (TIGR04372 family)
MSGIPRCVVNLFPTQNVERFYPWDTLILQRIRQRLTGRELSLRDSLEFVLSLPFTKTAELEACGLELIQNSPSEIREVVLEALHREHHPSGLSRADSERQRRFWDVVRDVTGNHSVSVEMRPRIGVSFLKHHESLLE